MTNTTTTDIAVDDSIDITALEQTAIDAGDKYLSSKHDANKTAIACGRALLARKKSDPKSFTMWRDKNMHVKERQCQKFMAIAKARDDAWVKTHSGADFLGINVEEALTKIPSDIEEQVRKQAKELSSPQTEIMSQIKELTAPDKPKKRKSEPKEPRPLTRITFIEQINELNSKISSLCTQTECIQPEDDFKKMIDTVEELSGKIIDALYASEQTAVQTSIAPVAEDNEKLEAAENIMKPSLQKAA